MNRRILPSQELLNKILRYEPETGKLFWLPRDESFFANVKYCEPSIYCRIWNNKYANKEAFTALDKKGYYVGNIFNKLYVKHRIIWKMVNGKEPEVVDHIDRNKLNNTIDNLRPATIQQNSWNTNSRKNSSSKYLGVTLRPSGNWVAQIRLPDKNLRLGTFVCEQEAALAYNAKAYEIYGEFANLNII